MSARTTAAVYAPQKPGPGAGHDNYTSVPSSYGHASNGRQPVYESPVIPDYDPDTTSHATGDVGSRPQRQFSMRRYDDRYTNNSLPPLRTDVTTQPRAQAPGQPSGFSGRRYTSDPISTTSPLSQNSGAIRKGSGSYDKRSSVHDRSPLQRLEAETKDEKRSRLLIAENAAREVQSTKRTQQRSN